MADEGFVQETHERLAALEQSHSALERRLVDHHKLANRLQTDSAAYNGKIDLMIETMARTDERMRTIEQSQATREVRLKVLEDDLLSRTAIFESRSRAAQVIAKILGLAIAAIGLFAGFLGWRRH